ncbi:MAG: RidA family protein [Clostridia bacterium]|nr:RidA family protein [Clostridia bacterium]
MSHHVYETMHKLNLELPEPPAKGGVYAQAKSFGKNLVYVSGCGPNLDGMVIQGKLGLEVNLEEGQLYARNCMLNVLSVLESFVKDLNRVKQVVKITVFVASADHFFNQPEVANGGSRLLVELFGEKAGTPSRSAIGVNALPGNIPVEIEALFELDEPLDSF